MSLFGTHTTLDRTALAGQHREIHLFLKEHPAGVLATVDPNNEPHAAVIYYSVDSSLTVTFLTKKRTKKSDNLTHNNHATLVVFDVAAQTVVQLTGLVAAVDDAGEMSQIFRGTLRASLHVGRTVVPPIAKIAAGAFVAYRLVPTQIRYSSYAPPEVGRSRKMFETIDLPL